MFDPWTYEVIGEGSLRSARVIVPLIVDLLAPADVVDVGCGQGWWLSVFREMGCDVVGVDGNGVERERLRIPPECFIVRDLTATSEIDVGGFDLAVSLEVAEHLPAQRADWFVAQLCSLANVVLFSAAIPAQGGNGHINEQWPEYWVERFAKHGYRISGALRWEFWDDERIECWYTQNLLLAVHADELARRWNHIGHLFEGPGAEPVAVVHPRLWQIYHPD